MDPVAEEREETKDDDQKNNSLKQPVFMRSFYFNGRMPASAIARLRLVQETQSQTV